MDGCQCEEFQKIKTFYFEKMKAEKVVIEGICTSVSQECLNLGFIPEA